MIQKTITYTDYDGNERVERFNFNLNKAECLELDISYTGGLQKMLERIVESQDIQEIFRVFKLIVMKAYGVKSDDGRVFRKSKELSEEFVQTEAFSELVMELLQVEGAAAAFINGMVPAGMAEEAAKAATGTPQLVGSVEIPVNVQSKSQRAPLPGNRPPAAPISRSPHQE